jgi:nitroimidazol reductase NimA-like FMN-containing flavoprotein (pyridoxamine 5'-phosphate oxidase superfamily)
MKDLAKQEMENLLNRVGDGVLAMSYQDVPYCLVFGFVYIDGDVYISLFPKGRKWGILEKNKKVCFTAFAWNEDHTEWASVVIDGKMESVTDLKGIEAVVKANMEKLGLDPKVYLEKRMEMYKKTMNTKSALKIFRIKTETMGGRKMKFLIK